MPVRIATNDTTQPQQDTSGTELFTERRQWQSLNRMADEKARSECSSGAVFLTCILFAKFLLHPIKLTQYVDP